jgi:transcriptional regulator with XRE-family HTH domain
MTKETGVLIQKLRLRRGWSQEDLAELCALSVRTIQRIERGHPASAESLKAIASVFEIDFQSLREPEMDKANAPGVNREETLLSCRSAGSSASTFI